MEFMASHLFMNLKNMTRYTRKIPILTNSLSQNKCLRNRRSTANRIIAKITTDAIFIAVGLTFFIF
jgi:hypothetical protein